MKLLKSIEQVDELLCREFVNCPKGSNYTQELQRLLEYYRCILKEYSLDGKNSIYENVVISNYIKRLIPCLKKLVASYAKGDLIKFNELTDWLFKDRGRKITISAYFAKAHVEKDSLWFRARLPKLFEKFERKDLYHVPFEKKEEIGTNRYSLIGFPCLYLGNTLECVDIETTRNGIKAVSCFKCLKDFDIYDFTFFSPVNNNNIIDNLISYPIKIAVSISLCRAGMEKDKSKPVFLEEYIVPQLILHCVIKQRRKGKPIGLSYTSVEALKNRDLHGNLSKYTNLVVPTFQHKDSGYCSTLKYYFSMTEPKIIPFSYLNNDDMPKIQSDIINMDFSQINN